MFVFRNYILTAAHCGCEDNSSSAYTITAGEHNTLLTSGREATYSVSQVIIHPSYNNITSRNYDFCLLKTSISITFNKYVQPACLPLSCNDECPTYSDVLISGWGTTQYDGDESVTLQKAKVPIVPRSDCQTAYAGIGITVTDNMNCAGYISTGGIDSCQGDSGGPMVCYREGYFQLDGVISFGNSCAAAGFPGVSGRVCQILDWLDETLGA